MNAPHIPTAVAREIVMPSDMAPHADLVLDTITAYDGLPTHLRVALNAAFQGEMNVPETHALAGRLLDEVPMAQMQLILTRLMCMVDERSIGL